MENPQDIRGQPDKLRSDIRKLCDDTLLNGPPYMNNIARSMPCSILHSTLSYFSFQHWIMWDFGSWQLFTILPFTLTLVTLNVEFVAIEMAVCCAYHSSVNQYIFDHTSWFLFLSSHPFSSAICVQYIYIRKTYFFSSINSVGFFLLSMDEKRFKIQRNDCFIHSIPLVGLKKKNNANRILSQNSSRRTIYLSVYEYMKWILPF